ncbi:MAG TPA: Ku protein [Gemmataceae bacterium]|jgi:DNA end-binding protein Ku|nr:Ku protein [Gemmataceae bacterium]
MSARSCWKGFIKLSLVAVPVKAAPAATSGGGDVHLHQLHADCHNRIQYKKVCPVHGEVGTPAIVAGYEHAKDQYVVVDPADVDQLRTPADHAITIDRFIAPEVLDPLYYNGRSYYLLPDGPVGQKGYVVLHRAMVAENRYAVAQVVLHRREQLVLLRPLDRLLALTVLHYDTQITKPTVFADEVTAPEVAPEELHLAQTLVAAASVAAWDYGRYQDAYTAKLTQLIEAKVAGKQLVAPAAREQLPIINLLDALRQSVAQAQESAAPKTATASKKTSRPSRRTARTPKTAADQEAVA